MGTENKRKVSNTFGIISMVIAIMSLITQKAYLIYVLLTLALIIIFSLMKDRSKVFGIIALVIALYTFATYFKETKTSVDTYKIDYFVRCTDCALSYTNETGGYNTGEHCYDTWHKQIITNIGHDDFILSASYIGEDSATVYVRVSVNGKEVKSQSGNGINASADAVFMPDGSL